MDGRGRHPPGRRAARSDPSLHRRQPRSARLAARRAAGLRRGRGAQPARPARGLRAPRRQQPACHLGVEGQAPGPQGKPGRRDVRGQRGSRRHRRAQEPEGRRRHRAGPLPAQALRGGDARADRRAPALQRDPPASVLVRRDLERHAALHGAVEAGARGELPVRRSDLLRAHRLPAHPPALDPLLRRGRRDPEVGAAPASARRHRQGRRALPGPGQAARADLAHPGVGQDLHPADRRAPDPRRQAALRERHRPPRGRPDRAGGPAQGLGGEAPGRDAAAGDPGLAGALPGGGAGAAPHRQARSDPLHDPQVRGDRPRREHPRQHLRLHRRGAPLGGPGPRHLHDGGGAECDHHRLHRHPGGPDRPGRRDLQDLRRRRRAGLSRQVLHPRVHRGRDHAAPAPHHGAERDDGAGRAARQGVLRAGRGRGRDRRGRAEPGPRPGRGPAHLPHGR